MRKSSFLIFFLSIHSLLLSIELVRYGTEYGGWTIPRKLLNEDSICYCAGAGEDLSFDLEIARRYSSNVYILDPTPRAIAHFDYITACYKKGIKAYINNSRAIYPFHSLNIGKLHYLPIGLWNENTQKKFYVPQNPKHVSHSILNLQQTNNFFVAECKKLSTIMAELGHNRIDLLKLDIEGAEWAVLDDVLTKNIPVTCICIEFDAFEREKFVNFSQAQKKVLDYISRLQSNGYIIIHKNGWKDVTLLHVEFTIKPLVYDKKP